tara:strand:+ start:1874 stop:2122 length:249 start_codon:yes stop_codon:yes gene_type:complete
LDNNNMTNNEIEKIARRVSELVLEGILKGSIVTTEEDEQGLLTQLAQAMTQLDYNLQEENYDKCAELKEIILQIEKQLNKFK